MRIGSRRAAPKAGPGQDQMHGHRPLFNVGKYAIFDSPRPRQVAFSDQPHARLLSRFCIYPANLRIIQGNAGKTKSTEGKTFTQRVIVPPAARPNSIRDMIPYRPTRSTPIAATLRILVSLR